MAQEKAKPVYVVRERDITQGLDGWPLIGVLATVAILAGVLAFTLGRVKGDYEADAAVAREQKVAVEALDLTAERDAWKDRADALEAYATVNCRK